VLWVEFSFIYAIEALQIVCNIQFGKETMKEENEENEPPKSSIATRANLIERKTAKKTGPYPRNPQIKAHRPKLVEEKHHANANDFAEAFTGSTPVTVSNAILGSALDDGGVESFADVGDSGAGIIRFIKGDVKKDPEEGEPFRIIRSELLGILYGIIWEESRKSHVGVYLPIERAICEIKKSMDIEIPLNVPDSAEQEWVFKEFGKVTAELLLEYILWSVIMARRM